MKFAELKQDTGAQRKFLIFVGVFLAAIGWLMLPSFSSHKDAAPVARAIAGGRTLTQATAVKPSPALPVPGCVVTTPAPVSAAPPDPMAMLLGKFQGQARLGEKRGACSLALETMAGAKDLYKSYSTLSCVPSVFELLAKTGKGKETAAAAEVVALLADLDSPRTGLIRPFAIRINGF